MNIYDVFKCPVCQGSLVDNNNGTLRCKKCAEVWQPEYIRGFWAGYVKRGKEQNG